MAGAGGEEILLSRNFMFEMDGMPHEVLRVDPGPMRCDLIECTGGTRPDNHKDFTVAEVRFENWRVEKIKYADDTFFNDIFQAFKSGTRQRADADAGSLIYQKADNQTQARRIDFFGYLPTGYYVSGANSQTGQMMTETLEYEVTRCEYL